MKYGGAPTQPSFNHRPNDCIWDLETFSRRVGAGTQRTVPSNVDAAVAVSFCGRQRSGLGGVGTTRTTKMKHRVRTRSRTRSNPQYTQPTAHEGQGERQGQRAKTSRRNERQTASSVRRKAMPGSLRKRQWVTSRARTPSRKPDGSSSTHDRQRRVSSRVPT